MYKTALAATLALFVATPAGAQTLNPLSDPATVRAIRWQFEGKYRVAGDMELTIGTAKPLTILAFKLETATNIPALNACDYLLKALDFAFADLGANRTVWDVVAEISGLATQECQKEGPTR